MKALVICLLLGELCLGGTSAFADVSGKSSAKETLLLRGVEFSPQRFIDFAAQGDSHMVELFLSAGMAVDAGDPIRNVSALHNAAAQGHLGLVKALMERGANPNRQDWHGVTPLIVAAFSGHKEVVQYLLSHGARYDISPSEAPTAMVAAVYGSCLACIEALLAAGADPHQPTSYGIRPLDAAETANQLDVAKLIRKEGKQR